MIHKNHHVTELNKQWHQLVAKNKKDDNKSKVEKLEKIKTNG